MSKRNAVAVQAFVRDVARAVSQLRRERGWTQAQFATELGIEPATLSRLETGKRPINLKLLATMANVLGVRVPDLVQGEAAPPPVLPPDEAALLAIWHELDSRGRKVVLAVAQECEMAVRGRERTGLLAAEPR